MIPCACFVGRNECRHVGGAYRDAVQSLRAELEAGIDYSGGSY